MSDADVEFFRGAAGIFDESEIRERIKANDNDVQAAIMDFLEGSPKYSASKNTQQWDEAAFGMSRDGTEQGQVSFRIDAGGDEIAIGGPSVAPSRPPSRANGQAPIVNGAAAGVEEWKQQQQQQQTFVLENPVDMSELKGHNFPGSPEEEDAEIERAIAASMAEAGMASQEQETGVTAVVSVNEVYFGPANRPDKDYDSGQWDLVPSTRHTTHGTATAAALGSSSTFVYEETAFSRVRSAGTPAFVLSAGPDKLPRLASVLNILHEIPAARNALLRVGQPAAKYFHHPAWWKGTPVEYPAQEMPHESVQLLAEEIHRLMAFLDGTERSYGCIDALLSTPLLLGERDPLTAMTSTMAENLEDDAKTVMFTHFTRHFRGDEPARDGDGHDAQAVALVDFTPASFSGEGYPPMSSLYDILDMLMWHQFILPPPEDDDALACIRSPGEVIIFRWDGSELENDIEVPEMICIDRYLEANKSVALSIEEGIAAAANRLAELRKLKDTIYTHVLPNNKRVSKLDHLAAMVERSKIKLASIDEDAAWRAADARWKASKNFERTLGNQTTAEYQDPETHKPRLTEEEEKRKKYWATELANFEQSLERCQRTIKKYEAIHMFYEGIHSLVTDRCIGSSVDELKALLNQIKKQLGNAMGASTAERAFARFEQLYPRTIDVDGWNDPEPVCKRYLRGVAVGDRVLYVCRNSESTSSCRPEPSNSSDQWWKLEYREDEAEPLKTEVVDITAVQMAAGRTKDKPILVYASEDAIKQSLEPLSEALSFFVRADNKIFRVEVANEGPPDVQLGTLAGIQSNSKVAPKRKFSSCSMDSNATNRTSTGDNSDTGDGVGNPFASPIDLDADREVVGSAQNTPRGAVTSAIETAPGASFGPRRRKTLADIAQSSHVEFADPSAACDNSSRSPPEMISRDSIPLIGVRGAAGAAATGRTTLKEPRRGVDGDKETEGRITADVDMVNMDVYDHDD